MEQQVWLLSPVSLLWFAFFLIYRYTEPGNKKVKNWKWKKYQGELKQWDAEYIREFGINAVLVSEEQFSFGETDFESSLCISDYKAIFLQAVCLV